MIENWRPVTIKPFGEAYMVSDLGRIKQVVRRKGTRPNRLLHPCPSGPDLRYRKVTLSYKGQIKQITVHILVAEAFLESRPSSKHEVNHLDGDKTNNAATNLQWATRSENQKHAYRILNRKKADNRGTKNPNSKLTLDDVIEIRRLYTTGNFSQVALSKLFNVKSAQIHNIVRHKHWT